MATYSFTTGTDNFDFHGGLVTMLATAATVNSGDALFAQGGATIEVSGGGMVDFSHFANFYAGNPTFHLDDNATNLILPAGIVGTVLTGMGADTIVASTNGSVDIRYDGQAQLDGDSISGHAVIRAADGLDLSRLGSLSGQVSLRPLTADATLTVDSHALAGLQQIEATGHLTLRANTGSLDLTLVHFVAGSGGSSVEIDGAAGVDTTFQLGNHQYWNTIPVTLVGNGAHDVVQLAQGADLSNIHLSGIETLSITGSATLTQTDIESVGTISGTGAFSAGLMIAGNYADLSHVVLTNIGSFQGGQTAGLDLTTNDQSAIVFTQSFNDTIHTGAGNDVVLSGEGNDWISTGSGNDNIVAGMGADTIYSGLGQDNISGTGAELDGDSILDFAQDGSDKILISNFNNATTTIAFANGDLALDPDGSGGQAPIVIHLGASYAGTFSTRANGSGLIIDYRAPVLPTEGNDTLIGTAAGDRIDALGGDDSVVGLGGDDSLLGGSGNDTLSGGLGFDTLRGDGGHDVFTGISTELNGDLIQDFGTEDVIRITDATGTAATVSLANGDLTIDPDGAGSRPAITLHLTGNYNGSFSLHSTANGLEVTYQAPALPSGSDDSLTGTAGSDTIDGLGGNDVISGLAGNDSLTGSNGNDTILGGDGNDTVMGLNDNDSVLGGNGDDLVRGGIGADYVDGGAGNDAVWGDPGNDTLVGGTGADRFFFIAGYGHDQVLDFNYADGDRIRLDKALSVASIADDANGDAVITTNEGSTITLVGHHTAEVQSGWIGL